jgi:hypothetical protein
MKNIFVGYIGLMIALLPCEPAWAWGHANRWGGGTAHAWGGTVHRNAFGGGTAHVYGGGATHVNAYGGASHYAAGGASHYRTTSYGGYDHYYGGSYGAYHPPTTVNHYYGSGCYNCGGWATAGAAAAGAAVGMAAGAAVASANTSAVTSSAYSAGYAAGSSATMYAMGAIYSTLPAGCSLPNVQGQTYYLCGNTWFSPFYGANGVSYRVVPTP